MAKEITAARVWATASSQGDFAAAPEIASAQIAGHGATRLTDEEHEELLRLLRGVIADDRFPLSPRVRCLRQILDKLEPLARTEEPFPPPKAPAEPSHARRRRR